MARSDLIIALAKAGAVGDRVLLRRTLEAMVAEERAKQHNVLADRLAGLIQDSGVPDRRPMSMGNGGQSYELFVEVMPRRKIGDLILPDEVAGACREVIEEQQRADLLRSHGLEPRHRVLLAGPPGNGKTSLAEAMAESLSLPLIVVRYEGVIGSFLGETAGRLRRLFDQVRTRQCVLFFDEFDTLGKERGDIHDTGEVKRVVSSLLLQIDDLPSHVVVVTATNHPELLDRAVWRRFQLRLSLPMPTRQQVELWLERLHARFGKPLGMNPKTVAEKLNGLSFAELEDFSLDLARKFVLSLGEGDPKAVVRQTVQQWATRFKT